MSWGKVQCDLGEVIWRLYSRLILWMLFVLSMCNCALALGYFSTQINKWDRHSFRTDREHEIRDLLCGTGTQNVSTAVERAHDADAQSVS